MSAPVHTYTPGEPCDYCGGQVRYFRDSSPIYRGTDYGPTYACAKCDARVGCHQTGDWTTPKGRLADHALRRAKNAAHAAFDPLWRGKIRRDGCSKGKARRAGYRWLAKQLGIEPRDCHIGMFNTEMCGRVVDLCKPYLPNN